MNMKNIFKMIRGGVISLIAMSSLPVVAQTLPSLPDVFVSNVTTIDNGVPDDKLDDVVVNADMLRNAKTGDYFLSAWYDGQDDGTGAGGHIWMKLSPNANTM